MKFALEQLEFFLLCAFVLLYKLSFGSLRHAIADFFEGVLGLDLGLSSWKLALLLLVLSEYDSIAGHIFTVSHVWLSPVSSLEKLLVVGSSDLDVLWCSWPFRVSQFLISKNDTSSNLLHLIASSSPGNVSHLDKCLDCVTFAVKDLLSTFLVSAVPGKTAFYFATVY